MGGTRIKAGLVDEEGRVLHTSERPTPPRFATTAAVKDAISAAVTGLLGHPVAVEHGVAAVGVAAAGFVDAERGVVCFAPHLPWRDEPLRDRLAHRLGRPVLVDNDANAAAWAEHRFGTGAGESHLVLITLGTGIGGAVLTHGVLQRGRHGLAGEFGHVQVVPDGRGCPCGNRGCWERYASGGALGRAGQVLVRQEGEYAAALAAACGGDPDALTGADVTRLAAGGDPAALELVRGVGRWLGIGLAGVVAATDPGTVVVGGGASEAGELLLAPAREALAERLVGRGHRPLPTVAAARLGARAGLIGAADLARSTMSGERG